MCLSNKNIGFTVIALIAALSLICVPVTYAAASDMSVTVEPVSSAVTVTGNFLNYSGDVQLIIYPAGSENLLETAVFLDQMQTVGGDFEFKIKFNKPKGEYTAVAAANNGLKKSSAFMFFSSEDSATLGEKNEIDSLSVTRYTPYLVNYHMTTEQNLADGKKGGEAGQMAFSAAISPHYPHKMLVGTDTSGIWYSMDGGNSWKMSCIGFESMGAVDIIYDPDVPDLVFAAGSPASADNITKYTDYTGVYKSEDGGVTWQFVKKMPFYRQKSTSLLCFGPEINGIRILYAAASSEGIFASSDRGTTWEKVFSANITFNTLVYDGEQLIAATSDGVYCIDNSEYSRCNSGLDEVNVVSIAVNPDNKDDWFCATNGSLYRSIPDGNGNRLWQSVAATGAKQSTTVSYARILFGGSKDGANPRLYTVCEQQGYSMRYSDDYGASFKKPVIKQTAFMSYNTGWWAEPTAIDPNNPNRLIVALDGELFMSTDGGNTLYASQCGYSGMRASGFFFDEYGFLFSFVDRGIVQSVSKNTNERYPLVKSLRTNTSAYGISRDPKNPLRIFVRMGSWSSGHLYESLDGGITFNIYKPEVFGSYAPYGVTFHSQNPDILYAGSMVSFDNGDSWSQMDYSVTVSPADSDVIYSKTGNNCIVRSDDCGRSWTSIWVQPASCEKITPDLFNSQKAYLGTYNTGMYVLDGTDCRKLTFPGININEGVYQMAQNPQNAQHLVCATINNADNRKSSGIYESYDGGTNWRKIPSIGISDVWAMKFHPTLPQVFMSTSSGTIVYEYDKYSRNGCYSELSAEIINGCVSVATGLTNMSNNTADVQMIIAVYSESDELIDIYLDNTISIESGAEKVTYKLFDNSGYKVKMFVWDKLDNISPITTFKDSGSLLLNN